MFVPYPTWGATISAYRAALVPGHLQGRVQSVATLLSLGAVPVAMLAVGAALQHVGGVPTVLGLFVIMAAATAYAVASKHIRDVPPLAYDVARDASRSSSSNGASTAGASSVP